MEQAAGHGALSNAGTAPVQVLGGTAVLLDDWHELGRSGAMQDDAVAAEVELPLDSGNALTGCAGGGWCQPLIGDERGDVLELFRGAGDVEASHGGDDRVG